MPAPGRPGLTGLLALLAIGCGRQEPPPSSATEPAPARIETPPFTDVATAVGLDYRHVAGATGEHFLPEIMGPGAALFDYDLDGDLDLYVVQGGDPLGAGDTTDRPRNRLYRNELIPAGELRFTDVSVEAGVAHDGYGMGVAVADIDRDGDPDLYVTNFEHNVLYRNDDGRFTDVTAEAGANDPRWSTSATFLDYDRDGAPDLFVAHYINADRGNRRQCFGVGGARDYCTPQRYTALHDTLFHNDGDGRFTDVTEQTGVGSASGPGLGVLGADFDGDGWTDIYVANDGAANQLWHNVDGRGFEEQALMSGTAYNGDGLAEASMGVTAADVDADGDEDLFMTHFASETNTLYLNDGTGGFYDATAQGGLARVSLSYTGFGVEWFDYDNDGLLDLFVANGAVLIEEEWAGRHPHPYQQPNQLFRNLGNGRFEDVSADAGEAFAIEETSRGAAFGDVDNDGDIDVVVTNNDGPLRLLRNDVGNRKHWLRVRLVGRESGTFGSGARVATIDSANRQVWRRAHTDGSYLCAGDPRVHFGLGDKPDLAAVGVVWPSGRTELWRDVRPDTELVLTEGEGETWSAGSGAAFTD